MPFVIIHTAYKNSASLREKLGKYRDFKLTNPIHIHCVSIGEFNAAKVLITKLSQSHNIIITTTTKTGHNAIAKFAKHRHNIKYTYFPFDINYAVSNFLIKARPVISLMLETEIWLNYARICHLNNIKLGIINARLSAKSYAKYKRFSAITTKALQYFDIIVAQNLTTANYFIQLGAKNVHTLPSMKFDMDLTVNKNVIANIRHITNNKKFMVCASTHDKEEEAIIEAYKNNPLDYLLVIIPRHPERFCYVEKLLIKHKLKYHKYSNAKNDDCSVLLVDAMGYTLEFYALSELAFIGGSLVNGVGGHNIIEAIAYNKLVITGNNNFNFAAIVAEFTKNNALIIVKDAKQLIKIANDYCANKDNYINIINNAAKVFNKNKGASYELLSMIHKMIDNNNEHKQ